MFLERQAEKSARCGWIEALLFWASICTSSSSLRTTPSITAEVYMVFTPHRHPNQVSLNLAWVGDGWRAIQQRRCSESDRAQTPDFNATCWIQGIFYAINSGMIGITLPPQNSEKWNPKSREQRQKRWGSGHSGLPTPHGPTPPCTQSHGLGCRAVRQAWRGTWPLPLATKTNANNWRNNKKQMSHMLNPGKDLTEDLIWTRKICQIFFFFFFLFSLSVLSHRVLKRTEN